MDSRERFYNAIFIGYGADWLWVARQSPVPATAVRWLAGIMFLGGIGRVISVAWYGWPHWFQVALGVVETDRAADVPLAGPRRRKGRPAYPLQSTRDSHVVGVPATVVSGPRCPQLSWWRTCRVRVA